MKIERSFRRLFQNFPDKNAVRVCVCAPARVRVFVCVSLCVGGRVCTRMHACRCVCVLVCSPLSVFIKNILKNQGISGNGLHVLKQISNMFRRHQLFGHTEFIPLSSNKLKQNRRQHRKLVACEFMGTQPRLSCDCEKQNKTKQKIHDHFK